MLSGVESAHLRQIVHRDLKPENVLIDHDGVLVVADWGAAHFGAEDLYKAAETKNDERLANFIYAAPEQRIRGQAVRQARKQAERQRKAEVKRQIEREEARLRALQQLPPISYEIRRIAAVPTGRVSERADPHIVTDPVRGRKAMTNELSDVYLSGEHYGQELKRLRSPEIHSPREVWLTRSSASPPLAKRSIAR
jgi:serine/threonine protein kinase